MRCSLVLLFLIAAATADDARYPAGRSEVVLEGLKTAVLVPEGLDEQGKTC